MALVPGLHAATAKRPLPSVGLDFLRNKVRLRRRSDWACMDPKVWRLRGAGRYDRMTVHHVGKMVTAASDGKAISSDLNSILLDHLERNYGDIGYHFAVDFGGGLWEGRSLAYEGAHVSDQNENNIGIVLLGNFDEQTPAAAQLECLKITVEAFREQYGIKKHRIFGHRDLGASACPGNNLYPHVNLLKV